MSIRALATLSALVLAIPAARAAAQTDVAVWSGGPASEPGIADTAIATLQARGHVVRDPAQVDALARSLFVSGAAPTADQARALAAALGVARLFLVWTEPAAAAESVVVRITSSPDGARGHITVGAAEARLGVARLLGHALSSQPDTGASSAEAVQPVASRVTPAPVEVDPTVAVPAQAEQPPTLPPAPIAPRLASFVRSQELAPALPAGGWNGNRQSEIVSLIVFAAVGVTGLVAGLVGISLLDDAATEGPGVALTIVGGAAFLLGGLVGVPLSLGSLDTPGPAAASGSRFGALTPQPGLSLSARL